MIYIVMGYGCHLTKKIMQYLNCVLENLKNGDIVITSGGFTQQKTASGISEALMMEEYLKEGCSKNVTFIKEESSITTYQNLKNSKCVISQIKKDNKITIVCDFSRSIKIWIMSLFIFGVPMPRIITQNLSESCYEKIKQIFVATPLDLLAEILPILRRIKEGRKRKLMKIS